MCLNCGCGIPDDDMGDPENIVMKDILSRIEKTAPKNGNTVIQELKNIVDMIQKEIARMEKSA